MAEIYFLMFQLNLFVFESGNAIIVKLKHDEQMASMLGILVHFFHACNSYFLSSDIDECKEKTSVCSQDCNNTIGSYKCHCRYGFRLTNDSHTCEGKTKLLTIFIVIKNTFTE